MAVKVITDHAVYAKNKPKLDGPNDPMLGPSDRRVECGCCSNSWFKCPGHPGVLRPPIPLYNIGLFDVTYKLLQAVCWNCSALLGDEDDPRVARHAKSRNIVKHTQTLMTGRGRFKCHSCKLPQPKYSKSGMFINRTWNDKKRQLEQIDEAYPEAGQRARQTFTPADALDIFTNISDADVLRMGMHPTLAHPRALIMQNVCVLPPNCRPAIMASEGSKRRGQDDTTNSTQDVIKGCINLRNALIGKTKGKKLKAAASLQQRANEIAKKSSAAPGTGSVLPGTVPSATATATASATSRQAVPTAAPAAGAGAAAAATPHTDYGSDEEVPSEKPFLVEHTVQSGYPSDLTDDEVLALRFAGCKTVYSITPGQSSRIWDLHRGACERLQNEVAVLFDNAGRAAPQSQQRSGAPKRALMTRLPGKTGQIRGAAMAKRCDQNARTVIAPDNALDIDELGVPAFIMNTLTMPETVNASNIERLSKAVRLGPSVAYGAARVLHATGTLTQLAVVHDRHAIQLQVGDVVERHLLDGDPVIFNRQPSLHRLSSLVFKAVRIADPLNRTNQLSLANTTTYNADFDGDEMNMHALQSVFANAEASALLGVEHNLVNPQSNAPCMGLVQDARVGAFILTSRDTFLDADTMHQCVGAIDYRLPDKTDVPPPIKRHPVTGEPLWSGKQLVSMLLPPISLERRVRGAGPEVGPDDAKERYILIKHGVLVHGRLCKAMLGPGRDTIIHAIMVYHGAAAVKAFISDFQRVMYQFVSRHGFTVGLRDCLAPRDVRRRIRTITNNADHTVAELSREVAELANHMTETELARVEAHILTILTSVLDLASRLVLNAETGNDKGKGKGDGGDDGDDGDHDHDRAPPAFGFRAMVESASKGNTNNIAQVMACLAQQVIEGARIHYTSQTKRTFPMFPPGAFSAAARGFIEHSYLDGLEPHEYFAHMMAGREGLVATAVKTADTGYTYRSLTKGMETNTVRWDATVQNAQDYIIEFIAGGDAMDPTRVHRVPMPVIRLGDADVVAGMDGDVHAAEPVLRLRDWLRRSLVTPLRTDCDARMLLPVNIADLLAHVSTTVHERHHVGLRPSDLEDPTAVTTADVQQLVDRLYELVPSPEAVAALELSVRWECRPSALRALRINTYLFRHMVAAEVVARTKAALVHPGDSVGVVAGESIGEPATQLTLNVFHSAGLYQRMLIMGVPRLQELVSASVNIKTPVMIIPFKNPSLTHAQQDALASSLQFLCLDSVLHSSYPQLDPPGDGVTQPLTTMPKDYTLMDQAVALYGLETAQTAGAPSGAAAVVVSPWVLRLVLNRGVLVEHGFTPELVARAIGSQMDTYSLAMVYSQPNAPTWVIRIRIHGDASEGACRRLHADIRESVLLGGVDGITQSRVITMNRAVIDPATKAVKVVPTRVIDTEGSALMRVATRDWADWTQTVTNDVQEVLNTLGMVAARALLYSELEQVVASEGGYIDQRHISQVVNTMTHRGFMMRYKRHGINRVDYSVMQRASYEEPVDMIMQAAITAEAADMSSLSECVLFGQKAPFGTGTVSLQHRTESDRSGAWAPDAAGAAAQALARAAAAASRPMVTSWEQAALRPGTRKRFRDSIAGTGYVKQTLQLRGTDESAAAWNLPAPQPVARDSLTTLPSDDHDADHANDGVGAGDDNDDDNDDDDNDGRGDAHRARPSSSGTPAELAMPCKRARTMTDFVCTDGVGAEVPGAAQAPSLPLFDDTNSIKVVARRVFRPSSPPRSLLLAKLGNV